MSVASESGRAEEEICVRLRVRFESATADPDISDEEEANDGIWKGKIVISDAQRPYPAQTQPRPWVMEIRGQFP